MTSASIHHNISEDIFVLFAVRPRTLFAVKTFLPSLSSYEHKGTFEEPSGPDVFGMLCEPRVEG